LDLLHVVAFIAGAVIAVWSCLSAIRAFMIPGAQHHLMGRIVFRSTQAIFLAIGKRVDPETRSTLYPMFGPLGLLAIYGTVMFLNGFGFAMMFWAVGGKDLSPHGVASALIDSGSALSTLGFASLQDLPRSSLSVFEALATTTVSALLIGYLPVIFSTFLNAEQAVTDLETETGGARCGPEVLVSIQHSRTGDERWKDWSKWFGRVGKNHGSLVANLILRAPESQTSWVTAAWSVLDAAALRQSVVEGGGDRDAAYCLGIGSDAAHRAIRFLGFADNGPATPGCTRAEFDAACGQLREEGIPLVPDLDAGWEHFSVLRAAYAPQLATLAAIKGAPDAPLDCADNTAPAPHREPLALPIRLGAPMPVPQPRPSVGGTAPASVRP
jgi:hypothetical protein